MLAGYFRVFWFFKAEGFSGCVCACFWARARNVLAMEDEEKTKDEQLADMQAQLERLRMEVEGAQNATLAVSAERDSLRGQLAAAAPCLLYTSPSPRDS